MSKSNSAEFSSLKPLCVNCMRNCSIENVAKLENAILKLPPDCIESLQSYIVLPFIVNLNAKLSEKVTIKCIDFLTSVFKMSKVKTFSFFHDIFVLMLSKISNFESNELIAVSEELKSSVCENLLCLVQCSEEDVLNEMYGLSFRPFLAKAFYILNILLREERSKSLLKAVLSTIGGFVYNEHYHNKIYKLTKLIAGEALASCLPGLSISLHRVVCGDDKQVHTIINMALNILTDLIVLTVGDETYERGIYNDTSSDVYQICYKVNINEEVHIPFVIKDDAWFNSVSEKLEILIKNVSLVVTHDHWKVRLEFVKCSKLLLFKCTKTLENCISILLSSLFTLSVDKNEVVSSHCKDVLVSLSEKLQSDNLILKIVDSIEDLISQLIKVNFSANDNHKLRILKSLLGYIDVCGMSLNKLIFSITLLERLIVTLISLIEFNLSELNVVEEMPVLQNTEILNLMWPKKRFKCFENEEILNTICKICYSLGHIGNSRLLLDYLLEKISSNNFFTLQCIFIIGCIVKGFVEKDDALQNNSALISEIMEILLSPSLFDVPIHKDDLCIQKKDNELSNEMPLSNNILNKNKLQVCLLLEAISNCSQCLGIDFQLHLKTVLCPVMEKAGSSNFIVSHSGQICLYHIAQSCKYKSIQELVRENADYINNIIMINFQHYMQKPEMAIVLRVAMEHSDAEALVVFRDLIFQVLDLLDYNQTNAYPLLRILLSVVVCIKNWFPCKQYHHESDISLHVKNSTNKSSLKNMLLEYVTLKKNSNDLVPEKCAEDYRKDEQFLEYKEEIQDIRDAAHVVEEIQDIGDAAHEVDEKKPDIPLHINIVSEIFKRCVHLQSSENQFVRMLSLETVELCIGILCNYENVLLPLVHEFWEPFLKRFTEDLFVYKAFNVLLVIANECGDFIRRRTLKDVMSKLVLFLQKEHPKSGLKCNFKQYQWTSDHSLQVLILSEIGNLCKKLDISNKYINAISAACLPYLVEKQPKILQEAAAKSLNALATIDSDAVWFYWNILFSEKDSIVPHHESLLKISFPYSNNSLTTLSINF